MYSHTLNTVWRCFTYIFCLGGFYHLSQLIQVKPRVDMFSHFSLKLCCFVYITRWCEAIPKNYNKCFYTGSHKNKVKRNRNWKDLFDSDWFQWLNYISYIKKWQFEGLFPSLNKTVVLISYFVASTFCKPNNLKVAPLIRKLT